MYTTHIWLVADPQNTVDVPIWGQHLYDKVHNQIDIRI